MDIDKINSKLDLIGAGYRITGNLGIEIIDYNIEDVVIHNIVRKIPERAFCGCKKLKTVKFGEGVEIIEEGAFEYCSVNRVILNGGLEKIYERAFMGCDMLEYINLDECRKLRKIGKEAFKDCERLRGISIVSELNYLEPGAFENCKRLKYVDIKNNLDYVGKWSFHGCDSLESVNIECNRKVTIGECAFFGCRELNKVHIPNISVVEELAFSLCTELKSIDLSNEHKKKIWQKSFSSSGLEALYINNLICLGNGVFKYCNNLKSVKANGEIINMGHIVFKYCKELEIVEFNGDIKDKTSVELFKGADKLKSVTINGVDYTEKARRI